MGHGAWGGGGGVVVFPWPWCLGGGVVVLLRAVVLGGGGSWGSWHSHGPSSAMGMPQPRPPGLAESLRLWREGEVEHECDWPQARPPPSPTAFTGG